ncbi:hypothetical protein, conserved [Eimeria tenella]|uniref:AMP-dependent synthetase/ligase domain-containing protein n=1 Tax=Eimeria tenella TaxID=5802 RepID=U6KKR8_EIMTE|nr:hypothetical protein, conserved [Eimeria tenella]CDJ37396.1 hypothetical protein, conserved [Eimeria tenella]|eukprot:XP_013228234.1 hypothetical protein, conserved [Eimeria tenella]
MLELPQHQPPVLFVLAATTGSKHEPSRPLSPLPSAKAGPNSPTSSRDNFSRSRKSENSTSYDARNPETTELFSVAADRSRSVNSTKSRQLFGVSHGREGSIYRSEQQKPLEGSTVPPQLAADSSASIRRPFDLLRRAAALFGDSPWLLTGDVDEINGYPVITYQQGYFVARSVGAAFDQMVPTSQLPQRDGSNEPLKFFGTWAFNSVELLLADFGAGAYGLTVVPMHPEMNPRRFLEVMIHTQMTHLCTDWRHLEIVLDLLEGGQLSNLSTVITLDAASYPYEGHDRR